MSTIRMTNAVPVMPGDSDVEQRSFQRLLKTYPVEVIKLDFPMPETGVQMRCCDISMGGVCTETDSAPYAMGETCQIKIHIPLLNKCSPGFFKVYENDAEQYFTALADVAWVRSVAGRFLIGFRFINVHSDQETALETFIQRAFAQS